MFIQLIKLQRRIVYEKKVVLVLTLMMLVALVACGGKSGTQQTAQQNAILGRWEIKEGKDSSWFYERFELFSDGTSVTSAGYQEKWISENGRLKIGDDVWSYTLSDNKLTLTAKMVPLEFMKEYSNKLTHKENCL